MSPRWTGFERWPSGRSFSSTSTGALFPGGAVGVDVFFALSAYLITGILLREQQAGPVRFADFYWRRAFRLVPALVIWVLLVAGPAAIAAHQTRSIPWSAAGALSYTSDFLQAWTHHVASSFDQSWSLAVEEQFYLLWPAVLIFGIARASRRIQALLFAALVGLALAVLVVHGNYFLPTGHLVPLALGAWAAWAMTGDRLPALGRRAGPWVGIGFGLVVLAALRVTPTSGLRESLWEASLAIAATGLIISADSHRGGGLARALGYRVPRWIGARSYGIYLYGLSLMQLVGSVTHFTLHKAAGVDIILTLVVAELSYRYIESPIRAAGRRWLADRRRPLAPIIHTGPLARRGEWPVPFSAHPSQSRSSL